jgi:hypothetical protein
MRLMINLQGGVRFGTSQRTAARCVSFARERGLL